jgi:nanoRNase/pAp phosphatase (c-di-AMP/oligoRNAs hydrolase)
MSGSVNVRIFSESLGNGGGHDRASGANFKSENGDMVEVITCIETVLEFMKNNKPVLS